MSYDFLPECSLRPAGRRPRPWRVARGVTSARRRGAHTRISGGAKHIVFYRGSSVKALGPYTALLRSGGHDSAVQCPAREGEPDSPYRSTGSRMRDGGSPIRSAKRTNEGAHKTRAHANLPLHSHALQMPSAWPTVHDQRKPYGRMVRYGDLQRRSQFTDMACI